MQKAKDTVKAFLKCSTKDEEGFSGEFLQQNESVFKTAFAPFYDFLKNLVPHAEQKYFHCSQHIDFNKFAKLWNEKFENDSELPKHKIRPELCWHIIRTFIKGNNIDEFLTPEDYQGLTREECSVSLSDYEIVYKTVWENWYKPLTVNRVNEDLPGEYWDDEDLVRFVIRKDYCKSIYPVVFCDEAQDFTRLELNTLLSMSLFSERKIYSHQISSIPFAFAGDPFQTLNPTGFRWEATKDSFVSQFIDSHSLGDGKRPDLNYRELEYNYRSDEPIVHFSNAIQGLRSKLFSISVVPQQPWRNKKNPKPVSYYPVKTAYFWDWVKEIQDIVFVIPCDDNEKKDFWEKSELASYLPYENATVMTPTEIKGLEYDNIAVCGFGTIVPECVSTSLANKCFSLKEELLLPAEYYLNKIYVAVSRAQKMLVILDSDHGEQAFWKYFKKDSIGDLIADTGISDKDIFSLLPGSKDLLEHGADLKSWADKLRKDGVESGNSYLLEKAAKFYRQVGYTMDAKRCSAEACFWEEKYLEAAELLCEIDVERSSLCFWLSGCCEAWEKLLHIPETCSFFGSTEHTLVSKFITQRSTVEQQITLLCDINKAYTSQKDSLLELERASAAWQSLAQVTIQNLLPEKINVGEFKDKLFVIAESLKQCGLINEILFGRVAYKCDNFQEAVKNLKDSKDPNDQKMLHNAKQRCQNIDQQISQAYMQKKWPLIVELYQESSGETLRDDTLQKVAIAKANMHDVSLAISLLKVHYDPSFVKTILNSLEKQKQDYNLLYVAYIQSMIAHGQWKDFIDEMSQTKKISNNQMKSILTAFAHCDANRFQQEANSVTMGQVSRWLQVTLKLVQKSFIQANFFEFGCAIEKAYNIKDSKEYYKNAGRYLSDKELIRAKKRLIVCFERHADYLEKNQGNNRDAAGNRRKAMEIREEIKCYDSVGSFNLPEYEFDNNPWNNSGIDIPIPQSTGNNETQISDILPPEMVQPKKDSIEDNQVGEQVTVPLSNKKIDDSTEITNAPEENETSTVENNFLDQAQQNKCSIGGVTTEFDPSFPVVEDKMELAFLEWKITRYRKTKILDIILAENGNRIRVTNDSKEPSFDDGLKREAISAYRWKVMDGALEIQIIDENRVKIYFHKHQICWELDL